MERHNKVRVMGFANLPIDLCNHTEISHAD